MANQQLVDYISQNKAKFSVDALKKALIQQGYSKVDVDEAANIATEKAPPLLKAASPPPLRATTTASLTSDPKFKETLKIFIIFGLIFQTIRYFIGLVAGGITMGVWTGFGGFDFAGLLWSLVGGAIGAAIGGLIFYFLFEPIRDFIKRVAFLSRFINNLFTLFWVPALVGFGLSALFAILGFMAIGASPFARSLLMVTGALGGPSFGSLVLGAIITLGGNLIASYIYAKMISGKLSQYYPW